MSTKLTCYVALRKWAWENLNRLTNRIDDSSHPGIMIKDNIPYLYSMGEHYGRIGEVYPRELAMAAAASCAEIIIGDVDTDQYGRPMKVVLSVSL